MMELGKQVSATNRLRRRFIGGKPNKKEWQIESRPVEGIYIGHRTYANGELHYEEDCGYIFKPTSHIKIALIVANERGNPIPVMYEEMSVCEADK